MVQGGSCNVELDVSRDLDSSISLMAHFLTTEEEISTYIHWSHQEGPLVFEMVSDSLVPVQCCNMFVTSFDSIMNRSSLEFIDGNPVDQVKGIVRERSVNPQVVGSWDQARTGHHLQIMGAELVIYDFRHDDREGSQSSMRFSSASEDHVALKCWDDAAGTHWCSEDTLVLRR